MTVFRNDGFLLAVATLLTMAAACATGSARSPADNGEEAERGARVVAGDSNSAETSQRSFVVIVGGQLHRAPDEPPILQLEFDRAFVFERGEVREGWQQLFTFAGESPCHDDVAAVLFPSARLELWVPTESVMPVLTDRHTETRGDDQIVLPAGTPLRSSDDSFFALAGSFEIPVSPPKERVASSFVAFDSLDEAAPERLVYLSGATMGGAPVLAESVVRGSLEGHRIRVDQQCLRFDLAAANARVIGEVGPSSGKLALAGESDAHRVSAGADVFWEDGRVAGKVVAETTRTIEGTRTTSRDELQCEEFTDGDSGGAVRVLDDVALCVRSADSSPDSAPGDPTARSSLGKDEIRSVIRGIAAPKIKACLDALLAADPDASGRVMTRFVVGSYGNVETVEITKSDFDDPSLHDCITTAFESTPFPRPRGGGTVAVKYPLNLSAPR